jgi:dephospho-CoA kinase
MIEDVIGEIEVAPAVLEGMKENEVAQSPGMKYKHYSPKAKVVLVNADKAQYEAFVNSRKDAYALCFDEDKISIPCVTFGKENDDLSQAKELFDALRKLDELGAKKVYARIPHKDGVGMAVYNRLIRAAAFDIIDLKKPFTIGLTGPTGAGKGYVCKILEQKGFKIIDCDVHARKVVEKGSPILSDLANAFGSDIIKNGELDRALLASRAFENKEKASVLNSIMHPAIIKSCEDEAKGLCVLDAPQLFEAGIEDKCYKVISVIASENVRIKRIMERDNISEEQARQRMSVQFSNDYFIDHSDYVIYNDNENLSTQIENILEVIL